MKKTMKRLQLIFAAILLIFILSFVVSVAAMATEPSKVIVKYQDKKYYVHTVADGDTLYSLSKTYGVSQEIIIRVNGMESADIVLGTKVYVPCIEGRVMQDNEGAEEVTEGKHVVSAGETLYSLSRKYGMTEEQLLEMNGLKSHTDIKAGMTLKVRMNKSSNAKAKSDGDARNGTASSRKQNDGNMYQGSDERASAESLTAANISQELADAKQVADSAVPEPALEEDALFAVVAPSTVLQVTLVLPFHVKGEVKENMVDFYRGVLLAMEDLKRDGYSIELSVFDTRSSASNIADIVNFEPGFMDAQLIIGPVHEGDLRHVLSHDEANDVPVVTPLSDMESLQSPVLFQLQAEERHRYDKLSELFDGSREVVTIYAGSNDWDYATEVLSKCDTLQRRGLNYVFDRESFFYDRAADGSNGEEVNFEELMRSPEKRLFVVVASNEIDVDRILTTISSTKASIAGRGLSYGDYTVLGNRKWLNMKNIDRQSFFKNSVVFVVPYHAKRNDEAIRYFDGRYIAAYGTLPSMFSYRGYDAAMIFCRKMFTGIDSTISEELFCPLTTPYRFEFEDGLYVNTEWTTEHYLSNFTILSK